MVFHEILLYSGKCVSHRLVFVEILMCGHNGRPNGLRANDSKFGHLTLGYRPLLTVIKNTLINHSGHRHFPYMDSKWHQLHLHASLRRQSSSSILHCESPISFPRRIVPRRWKQPKRPPRRRLPAKSSTAAKLIDALPADALSELSLRRPSSRHPIRITPAIIRRIVIDADLIAENKHSCFPIPCTTIRSTKI